MCHPRQTNSLLYSVRRIKQRLSYPPPPPKNLNKINRLRPSIPWLLLFLFLLTGPAPVTAQTVTARLSVDKLFLTEGAPSTSITVTATLSQAATTATTIALDLPTTRPTSPFLLPGMTVATQGASGDYTTTFNAATHTISIAQGQHQRHHHVQH